MRIFTDTFAAAALLASTTSAFAGGLSPEITEAPVAIEEVMAPAAPSVSPTIIVLGVLGALLLVSMTSDDEGTPIRSIDR